MTDRYSLSSASKNIWSMLKAARPDLFVWLILSAVLLAFILPLRGRDAELFGQANNSAVSLLFLLHGARLSRQALLSGIGHWRLHLLVLAITFLLFPLLGFIATQLARDALSPALITGLLYLCFLPSTVQSSIAYASMAGGNVPAAICSASLSNVVGVVLTPLLVSTFLGAHSASSTFEGVRSVAIQVLMPFLAGHLVHPLIGRFLDKQRTALVWIDRGVIIAIVYRAFGDAYVHGVWTQISAWNLFAIGLIVVTILAVITLAAVTAARCLGFSKADVISVMFCGSQKSLASGAPMASILFPAAAIGGAILPLMIYHQAQLMLGAAMARWKSR